MKTRDAVDNLREYVADSCLPVLKLGNDAPGLPPDTHRSHTNYLKVMPENYRHLRTALPLDLLSEEKQKGIRKWLYKSVPSTPIYGAENQDPRTGIEITLPTPNNPRFNVAPLRGLPFPSDIQRLATWLELLPLNTANRAFQLIHPDRAHWTFVRQPETLDADKYGYFVFQPRGFDSMETYYQNRMREQSIAVIFQPPWFLSDQDLLGFCNQYRKGRGFPIYFPIEGEDHLWDVPANINNLNLPYKTSMERVWAKVWDTCARNNVHWFVLTSYNKWAFGYFSPGYSQVQISAPIDYNSAKPNLTITELLLAWMSAPFTLDLNPEPACPDGFRIVDCLPESTLYSLKRNIAGTVNPTVRQDFPQPPISENSWYDNVDDELKSSAGVSSASTDTTIKQRSTSPIRGIQSNEPLRPSDYRLLYPNPHNHPNHRLRLVHGVYKWMRENDREASLPDPAQAAPPAAQPTVAQELKMRSPAVELYEDDLGAGGVFIDSPRERVSTGYWLV